MTVILFHYCVDIISWHTLRVSDTAWYRTFWTVDGSPGITAGTHPGGGSSVFKIIVPLSRMDLTFCRIQSLGFSARIVVSHSHQAKQ